jgi:hypothetical protein
MKLLALSQYSLQGAAVIVSSLPLRNSFKLQEKDGGAVTTSLEHDFKHLALKLNQGIPIKAVPSNNSPCKIMLLNVSAP